MDHSQSQRLSHVSETTPHVANTHKPHTRADIRFTSFVHFFRSARPQRIVKSDSVCVLPLQHCLLVSIPNDVAVSVPGNQSQPRGEVGGDQANHSTPRRGAEIQSSRTSGSRIARGGGSGRTSGASDGGSSLISCLFCTHCIVARLDTSGGRLLSFRHAVT